MYIIAHHYTKLAYQESSDVLVYMTVFPCSSDVRLCTYMFMYTSDGTLTPQCVCWVVKNFLSWHYNYNYLPEAIYSIVSCNYCWFGECHQNVIYLHFKLFEERWWPWSGQYYTMHTKRCVCTIFSVMLGITSSKYSVSLYQCMECSWSLCNYTHYIH